MLIENLSIVLSIMALCSTIVSVIPTLIKKIDAMIIDRHTLKCECRPNLNSTRIKEPYNLTHILKCLAENVHTIYSHVEVDISVYVLTEIDEKDITNSKVIEWVSYPSRREKNIGSCTIKNNTDFRTIIINQCEYFFVSDLKEYSAIDGYVKDDRNFLKKYQTTIVCPIYVGEEKESILGFLSLNSPQKLNNVKKNKEIMSIVKVMTSELYKCLKSEVS